MLCLPVKRRDRFRGNERHSVLLVSAIREHRQTAPTNGGKNIFSFRQDPCAFAIPLFLSNGLVSAEVIYGRDRDSAHCFVEVPPVARVPPPASLIVIHVPSHRQRANQDGRLFPAIQISTYHTPLSVSISRCLYFNSQCSTTTSIIASNTNLVASSHPHRPKITPVHLKICNTERTSYPKSSNCRQRSARV